MVQGGIISISTWLYPTEEKGDALAEDEYSIPKKLYKDPLTFHLIDYPTRIYGNVDLTLK